MREGTAEQNSPTLAFFHPLVTVEQSWDSKRKCRCFPHLFLMAVQGFCFVLLYKVGLASLQTFMDAPHCSLDPGTCREVVGVTCSHGYLSGALQTKRNGKEKRENYGEEQRPMKK